MHNNNCRELETVLIVATQPKYTGTASEVTHLEINPKQSHILAVVYKIYIRSRIYIFLVIILFYICVFCKGSLILGIEDWGWHDDRPRVDL